MDIVEKTKELRDAAWQAVLVSDAYRTFKSLDDAVQAMTREGIESKPVSARSKTKFPTTRITQGDVAFRVLRHVGEPLPVGRWLDACIKDGINIKGDDPLANFRSTVSRDKRFYSFQRNNMYFWWLTGIELPTGFMPEPEESDLWGSGTITSKERR